MRPVAGVLASLTLFVLLGGLEWQGSRARWLRALEVGDDAHRIEAILGLGSLPGAEVDAALVAALEDRSADVREQAALACAQRALRACAPAIGTWLESTDPAVRAVAARALGRVGSDADVPRLARVLGDARPQVRRAAVLGLAALGGAAVHALVSALTDADPIVRERAATALGAVAHDAGERVEAATALLSLSRDEAPEVRAAGLDALGALGDPRSSAAAAALLDDDVIDVRLAAMRALARVPSSLATAALVHASLDEDREGRAALAALANVPEAAALDAIVAALLRPSVARSAEDALEHRMAASEDGRREVVAALARALGTGGPDRVVRIAGSASRLSLRASIAGLEDALLPAARIGDAPAIEALGRTGADVALVPVLDALASRDAGVRTAALAGLEGFTAIHAPDGRVLDPLTVAFPHLDADEQARAVAIVGTVASDRAAGWLIARLDDAERPARVSALRALRDRAPASAAERILAALDDRDAEIRTRAALVLGALPLEGEARDAMLARLAERLVADAPADRHAVLLALGSLLRDAGSGEGAARARDAIDAVLEASDPELASSAAWAVAASRDRVLTAGVREGAAGPSAVVRTLRALAGAGPDDEGARRYARDRLDASDVRVVLAALVLLGEIGDASALDEICARASSLRFPAHAAAAFALARGAARGIRAPGTEAALAALAASHDPYVRANVAIAAAHLGLASLGDVVPLDWLAAGGPPMVRAAAARWAFAVRGALDAARVEAALAACTTDASQPTVARACAGPALPTETQVADVIAVDGDARPMPDRLVALRLADGTALVTYTDARGRVRLEDAPAGPLSLDAPESAVLAP